MRHLVRSALCVVVGSLGVGCGDNCEEGVLDVDVCDVEALRTFDVGLVNDAEEAIHILRADEEFGPENRIAPGGARSVREAARIGSVVPFRAGRNGQVTAAVECPFEGGEGGRLVVYTEDGGPALVCVDWEVER